MIKKPEKKGDKNKDNAYMNIKKVRKKQQITVNSNGFFFFLIKGKF